MKKPNNAMLPFGILLAFVFILAACGHRTSTETTVRSGASNQTSSTASVNTSDTATKSGHTSDAKTGLQNTDIAAAKKHIASTSLLTNELTGKGAISLGDSTLAIKRVLAGYQANEGSTIKDESGGQYGDSFSFGDVTYLFDSSDKLIAYYSWDGAGSFETTKGLRIGDTLGKALKLYGSSYSYDSGGESNFPSYAFTFKNCGMSVTVDPAFVKGDPNSKIVEIGCSIIPK